MASRRADRGYAAILMAALTVGIFLPLSAIGVDVAQWQVSTGEQQKAADAAALAGVRFMPGNFSEASATALAVAARNGFTDSTRGVAVSVAQVAGSDSRLEVTITAPTHNAFGAAFGAGTTTIARSAVADYTAPAPMGSPCNTFGNEPPSTTSAAQPVGTARGSTDPICQKPNFWGGIEGPGDQKVRGDRFMSDNCATGGSQTGTTSGCTSTSGPNPEYRKSGYFFMVHVDAAAVGAPIDLQVYDPAYVPTGNACESLPLPTSLTSSMNPYAPDSKDRYAQWKTSAAGTAAVTDATAQQYCAGDTYPEGSGTYSAITSTWALRGISASGDPLAGAVMSTEGCVKQFRGQTATPATSALTYSTSSSTYDPQLAQVFHQWYSLCTFTPTTAGDYYLQARTNLKVHGLGVTDKNPHGTSLTPWIYTCTTGTCLSDVQGNVVDDDTSGGQNDFALRAVSSAAAHIAVSGLDSMPMGQFGASPAKFALIRALPNTAGEYISFDFFDVGDSSPRCGETGNVHCSVSVVAPPDSNISGGTPTGCTYSVVGGNNTTSSGTDADCSVPITNAVNNGGQERLVVPIPSSYTCGSIAVLTNCWFRVQISFDSGGVTDFTTWTANIAGTPVRLVQ